MRDGECIQLWERFMGSKTLVCGEVQRVGDRNPWWYEHQCSKMQQRWSYSTREFLHPRNMPQHHHAKAGNAQCDQSGRRQRVSWSQSFCRPCYLVVLVQNRAWVYSTFINTDSSANCVLKLLDIVKAGESYESLPSFPSHISLFFVKNSKLSPCAKLYAHFQSVDQYFKPI
jgi:hypothetical protein